MLFEASPRENILSAIEWRSPWWLPCPLLDGSVGVLGHGLVEHVSEGIDDWGLYGLLGILFQMGSDRLSYLYPKGSR